MVTRYPAMPDRGVEGAPFVVLLHTAMPSILVELSFISNPQEEQRMRLPEYHRTLAQGIWQGVQRFLQTSAAAAAMKG
jgi:N-acetylmuramoyl-L-alanine amidase